MPVEPVGESRKVTGGIFRERKGIVTPAQAGLEVAEHGVRCWRSVVDQQAVFHDWVRRRLFRVRSDLRGERRTPDAHRTIAENCIPRACPSALSPSPSALSTEHRALGPWLPGRRAPCQVLGASHWVREPRTAPARRNARILSGGSLSEPVVPVCWPWARVNLMRPRVCGGRRKRVQCEPTLRGNPVPKARDQVLGGLGKIMRRNDVKGGRWAQSPSAGRAG